MPNVPAPLLCLWSPSAVDPACTAAWRQVAQGALGKAAARTGMPVRIGDPVMALRAAASANPGRDLLLVDARATVSVDGVRKLLHAAGANPQFAVISALGRAVPALDPLPEDADAERGEALLAAWGEPVLFSTAYWSLGMSFWRARALSLVEDITAGALPERLAGAVHGALYVASPRVPGITADVELPLQALRARLAHRCDAPGWAPAGRPVLLHILHGWGGGAERFVRDMMRTDNTRAHLVLVARGSPDERQHGQHLALHHDLDGPPLREWPLATPIADTALHSPEYAAVMAALVAEWDVAAVLVSSLIGHSLDALRSGLPTAICTHDYYPLWPVLHADFGDESAEWDDAVLTAMLQDARPDGPFAQRPASHWIALRTAYLDALAIADATLVAPTHGVRANQCRIAPLLAQRRWQVIAHGIDLRSARPAIDASPRDMAHRLRVLVLGSIHGGKGEALLSQVLPQFDSAESPVEFVLLGSGDAGMRFFGRRNVHMRREYAHAQLPKLVAELQPDLALLPVSVAETWSYTLSELWSLGVPVLSTRLGSLAERIEHGVTGLLVDATSDAIAATLLQLARDRNPLQTLHAPALPSLQEMIEAWQQALPASVQAHSPALAASPGRIQALARELELTRTSERVTDLGDETRRQRAELDRRAAWATELESGLRESEQLLAAASASNQQHRTEQLALQASIEDQRRQLAQLIGQLDEAHRRYRIGEQALADALRKFEDHRSIAAQHEAEASARLAEKQRHLATAQDRLTDKQNRLVEMQRQLADMQVRLAESDRRLLETSDALEQQEREMHAQHLLYADDTADLARQRDVALAQRNALDAERALLLHSRSWRYTAPLRSLRSAFVHATLRLRFSWLRARGLTTRTLASLRRRGLSGTFQRARQELRQPPVAASESLDPTAADATAEFAIPSSLTPRASIVVPVYNHLAHTLACLRSIANSGDATPFEVIVVDDASSDATAQRLAGIAGLRYLRNPRNLGFIGSCNAGAAMARGDTIVFLNNDTTVKAGWLDALLRTFEEYPEAGLVGAKLVYPDGRLQEAGGIVFDDASGWNYGRFDEPEDPRYNHVRDVDYCSGAAIALPTALFRQLGGFDTRYAPAYYEDTDLAMQVRAAGMRVLYQPASLVVHFEGVSSGTDINAGVKAHQAINQRTFFARWRHELASHPTTAGDIQRASDHRARKRVLVIDACTPMPDRDSGSLRMFNLLRLLREEGCAVTFFADNLKHDGDYTLALQQLGVQVWWSPWLRDVPRWFAEHGRSFDVIMASRHYVASNYLLLARKLAPQAQFVFDTVDLHYLREQREAELSGDPGQQRVAQQTRARELRLIREADLTLVVSPVEQALLAREEPAAKVAILSNVHHSTIAQTPFRERRDLVFVGGYRHPPNADAALWLARDIYPLIRARRPDIALHLIGSDATTEVLALGKIDGVQVHGHVPDLAPYMDGCRIGLAPLRYGAGVKGKINLSMVHGQPVVATAAAVEGMHLRDGLDVLVADEPDAFAAAVLRLYDDAQLWQTLAHNGLVNVEQHFSFDAARRALRAVLA
jgi:GT2 family glycosyltransferase